MTAQALALIMLTASQANNLPPGLLSALCFVESSHRSHVINQKDGLSDSMGLCQIKSVAAKHVGFKGSKQDLMEPSINAIYAAKYLRYQIDRYDGDILKGISAYNMGRYKELNGNAANLSYVQKVLKAWSEQR